MKETHIWSYGSYQPTPRRLSSDHRTPCPGFIPDVPIMYFLMHQLFSSTCGSHLDVQVFTCEASYLNTQVMRFWTVERNWTKLCSVVSLAPKLHPALPCRWEARPFSLPPLRAGPLDGPSMGAAALGRTAALTPRRWTIRGGGSSWTVCTGCPWSRSLIESHQGIGSTAWKYTSAIHWSTTATTTRGESRYPPPL